MRRRIVRWIMNGLLLAAFIVLVAVFVVLMLLLAAFIVLVAVFVVLMLLLSSLGAPR